MSQRPVLLIGTLRYADLKIENYESNLRYTILSLVFGGAIIWMSYFYKYKTDHHDWFNIWARILDIYNWFMDITTP